MYLATVKLGIKRLVRKMLCFSKSIEMHELIIGLFIDRYAFGLPI